MVGFTYLYCTLKQTIMKSTWAYRNGQKEMKRAMESTQNLGTSWMPVKRCAGIVALAKDGMIRTFSNRKQANAALVKYGDSSGWVTASWPFLVCKSA